MGETQDFVRMGLADRDPEEIIEGMRGIAHMLETIDDLAPLMSEWLKKLADARKAKSQGMTAVGVPHPA